MIDPFLVYRETMGQQLYSQFRVFSIHGRTIGFAMAALATCMKLNTTSADFPWHRRAQRFGSLEASPMFSGFEVFPKRRFGSINYLRKGKLQCWHPDPNYLPLETYTVNPRAFQARLASKSTISTSRDPKTLDARHVFSLLVRYLCLLVVDLAAAAKTKVALYRP
jgi:hypothetical protein